MATAAKLAVHLIFAVHFTRPSSIHTTSIVCASLEGVLLVVLASGLVVVAGSIGSTRQIRIFSGIGAFFCVSAAATSVATTVILSNATTSSTRFILGADQRTLLTTSAVVIGVSVPCQLAFIILLYCCKSTISGQGEEESGKRLPPHIKAIRYSRTIESQAFPMDSTSKAPSPTLPRSSSSKSATETVYSSYAARSIASGTRLLSLREKNRTQSFDSQSYKEGSTITIDSVDSWDVPGGVVHGSVTSTPPHRVLEPIPASPTTSKATGPPVVDDLDLNLPAPAPCRRSRSYSPARRPQVDPSLPEPPSEAHIHPLFRSDSPVPPPNVTPGTVVTAAPDDRRVISDRQGVRRFRSDSQRTHGTGRPLSKKNSCDTFSRTPSLVEMMEAGGGEVTSQELMTPPIPEWILTAGTRSSLNMYESRKLKAEREGKGDP